MSESRTKNTKRNIVYSFVDTAISMGFQFISRTLIVTTFSNQYLGLSSLFTSILQVLNMAELGFSVAIIYNMYKPLAEHDVETVCSLLKYYRRIYRIVGTSILALGFLIIPFIPLLINGEIPKDVNIYAVYIIYLANTSVSYFLFAYKSSLLTALQRLDLMKISYSIANILQYAIQIFSILVLKNFYIYVGAFVLGTAAKNVLCGYIAAKKFPEYRCVGDITEQKKKDIILRVKGLLIGNISSVTYTTLDSIIISAYIGLSAVGIYNNYIVIYHGVMNFIVLIRNAMQASVGNSIAVDSLEKNYRDMVLWQFMFSSIATVVCTALICLYQPFMIIWMGEDMLLPMRDILLLSVWTYLTVVPHAFYLYLSGNGMWWEIRWIYIFSTVCNLVLNLVLGRILGITGIILATVIDSLISGCILQCIVVFKKYYKEIGYKQYFVNQLVYLLSTVLSGFIAYFITRHIHVAGITGLLLKTMVSLCVSSIVIILSFRKAEEYKKAKIMLLKTIKL